MAQLHGILATICTPFAEDGATVDSGRCRDYFDGMVQAGLAGRTRPARTIPSPVLMHRVIRARAVGGGGRHAVSPPSIATIDPVAKVAASLARNSTGPASSSVLAMRRCAQSLAMIR